MRRLTDELTQRCRRFGHRMLDVAETLERGRRSRRVIDQIVGCGTSVGANVYEADEALSRPDFCTAMGRSLKEVREAEYWLDIIAERKWVPPDRLAELRDEAAQLRKILGLMISRTRRNDANK